MAGARRAGVVKRLPRPRRVRQGHDRAVGPWPSGSCCYALPDHLCTVYPVGLQDGDAADTDGRRLGARLGGREDIRRATRTRGRGAEITPRCITGRDVAEMRRRGTGRFVGWAWRCAGSKRPAAAAAAAGVGGCAQRLLPRRHVETTPHRGAVRGGPRPRPPRPPPPTRPAFSVGSAG